MPTLKYYAQTQLGPKADKHIKVTRKVIVVKNITEAKAVAKHKGFIRFCTGNLTLDELVARRKIDGKSDWYV